MKREFDTQRPADSVPKNHMNPEDLRYAIDHDILDLAHVQELIEMDRRNKILSAHEYSIWQGKNGSWYTYIADPTKGRRLIKRAKKQDLEDFLIEKLTNDDSFLTLRKAFHAWNDRRFDLKKISASTHIRYECEFNKLVGDIADTPLDELSPMMLVDYLERIIPKYDLTAKRFTNCKTLLRGTLKFARRNNWIDFRYDDVFDELDVSEKEFKKVYKEDYEEVFNEEEMQAVIDECMKNPDVKNLAILLLFATGVRVGELTTIKKTDFVTDYSFNIRRTETKYKDPQTGGYVTGIKEFPKTFAGCRTVVIPQNEVWIVQRLLGLNPEGEFLLMEQGHRVRGRAICNQLKSLCRKSGVYVKTPHKARKTYGSILLDNHVDQRLITEQMGHTSIGTTEQHYHRNRRSLEKKQSVLSQIHDFSFKSSCKPEKSNQKGNQMLEK